ncbi:MAG: hypothetical protein NTY15_09815 [Planctomycetota bacterium]|nr:hypothetical protein [Planctomycetota bacterium]
MNTKTQVQPRSHLETLPTFSATSIRVGRRLVSIAMVIVGCLTLRVFRDRSAENLDNEAFVSGYSLAAICVFLMLLGVRKRVITTQIGRLAVWQRTHHYLGLLSVGAYALHAGVLTTGWLESMLALSFWAIALTGLIGWYVNRTSPKLLAAAGGQILRQDIPEKSKLIAKEAYSLALTAAGKNDTAALADHYQASLSTFFSAPRGWGYQIRPSGGKRRKMLDDLDNIDRYLSDEGRTQRRVMSVLVRAKDDLDFQSAIQNRIRFWAASHTWVLGCFVVLSIAHVIIAHRFTSSW